MKNDNNQSIEKTLWAAVGELQQQMLLVQKLDEEIKVQLAKIVIKL